ncbi:hypothetical protein CPB84DRAFT_1772681, partial [Gymnopilus junonius]
LTVNHLVHGALSLLPLYDNPPHPTPMLSYSIMGLLTVASVSGKITAIRLPTWVLSWACPHFTSLLLFSTSSPRMTRKVWC